jgi:hypothetical protein
VPKDCSDYYLLHIHHLPCAVACIIPLPLLFHTTLQQWS